MIRKTTSEDETKPTLLTEIKKEFGWVAVGFIKWKDRMVATYPKQIFVGMVALILVSFILRFTILVPDKADPRSNAPVMGPAIEALSEPTTGIQEKLNLLEEATNLRNSVQAVLLQETLTKEDSLYILRSSQKLKQMEYEISKF